MDSEGHYYCEKHCSNEYIQLTCCSDTNGKLCNKKPSFFHNNCYYCKVHSKKLIEPTCISCQHKGKGGKLCGGLVSVIDDKDNYFCEKHIGNVKRIEQYDMFYLGSHLYKILDTISIWNDCDVILLENQPFMKNQRMKSMQIMLYSYFLCKNNRKEMDVKKIINFNAKHKLDFEDAKSIEVNDKSAYKTRKKQGIEAVYKILHDKPIHLEYLKSHKKKDDLCDAFMQALSYYNK